ncbi:hypothetical protein FRC12_007163 [Ceratobasidium sp. 428]|nr:hypothetical protein FRC12_007163 [Ceratobasidium sp. 428]
MKGETEVLRREGKEKAPERVLDWSEFDNQDMRGSDMLNGSFSTTEVSICRNTCAGISTCQRFVLTPFSGSEKDRRSNCFLKAVQRPTQTVMVHGVSHNRSF